MFGTAGDRLSCLNPFQKGISISTSIRISVDIPDPKKAITEAVKNKSSLIDRIDVSISTSGSSTVTCTYDEKKHTAIDKSKLEKELKEAIGKLGYKVR